MHTLSLSNSARLPGVRPPLPSGPLSDAMMQPGGGTPPRRKVRCPKCTALLSEPASPVFECPICTTLLVGKGGTRGSIPSKNGDYGQSTGEPATNGGEEGSTAAASVTTENAAITQEFMSHKSGLDSVNENRGTQRECSVDIDKGCNPVGVPLTPKDSVDYEGVPENEKANAGQDLSSPLVDADNRIKGKHPFDNSVSRLIPEDRSIAAENENVNRQDHERKIKQIDGNRWSLQAQMFKDGGYDLSFKYSLRSSTLLESEDLRVKTLPTESPLDRIDAYAEGSSDRTEDESYTSGSESASEDGSESDFDFPAPSPENLLSEKVPSLFHQTEPHQLEMEEFDKGEIDNRKLELSSQVLHIGDNASDVDTPEVEHHEQGDVELYILTHEIQDKSHSSRQLQISKQPLGPMVLSSGGQDPEEISRNARNLLDSKRQQVPDTFVGAERKTGDPHSKDSKKAISERVEEHTWPLDAINMETSIQSVVISSRSDTIPAVGFGKVAEVDESHRTLTSEQEEGSSAIDDGVPLLEGNISQVPSANNCQPGEPLSCDFNGNVLSATDVQNIERKLRSGKSIESEAGNTNFVEQDLYSSSMVGSHAVERLVKQEFPLFEPQRFSNDKSVNMLESRIHHQQNDALERLRLYDSEGRLVPQIERQKKMHSSFLSMQNCRAEMNDQNPGCISNESGSSVVGYSLPNLQQYGCSNYHHVSDSFGLGIPPPNNGYSSHGTAHLLMVPVPMQDQAFSQGTYRPVSPVCMLCHHHQHSHMPQIQMPHCSVCFSQSVSITHQTGSGDCWSCLSHNGPVSACGGQLLSSVQPCFSNMAQIRNTRNAELSSQTSCQRTGKYYPPLPQGCAAPYIICKGCSRVLKVPAYLPFGDGILQKIRCGACSKISKFSFHQASNHPLSTLSMVDNVNMVYYHPSSHSIPDTRHHSIPGVTKGMGPYQQSYGNTSPAIRPQHMQVMKNDHAGPTIFSSKHSDHDSQRNCEIVVASLNDGPKPCNIAQLQPNVDEKEEGLDFGAPRISDGDSLDQSESRTRSPENDPDYNQENSDDVTSLKVNQRVWATAKLQQNERHCKKPGSPLLVLLNQESKKFNIPLTREEFKPAVVLPILDLPPSDQSAHRNAYDGDRGLTHGPRSQHSVSRSAKYIPGFLRRSLNKGGY